MKVSNLKYHIKSKHPKIYKVLLQREKSEGPNKSKQASIVPFLPSMVVTLSKLNVLKGLLHSVTVDGRPYASIKDGLLSIGFRPVMDPLPVKYNRRNIVDLIEAGATYIRQQITDVLKNSLVSVKVDGTSRFSRSFLGMNVQVTEITICSMNMSVYFALFLVENFFYIYRLFVRVKLLYIP